MADLVVAGKEGSIVFGGMTSAEWMTEIESAEKRMKDFVKEGRRLEEIYNSENSVAFNILFSNSETLLPALYSATPRPLVRRRQTQGVDELGKISAVIAQRILRYLLDNPDPNYPSFDEVLERSVLSALVPGWGVAMVKYEADISPEVKGEDGEVIPESVSYETICLDLVDWDRLILGYAPSWARLPWYAIRYDYTKAEIEKLFPDTSFTFTSTRIGEDSASATENIEAKEVDLTTVYTLWFKESKQVAYFSPNVKDRDSSGLLKVIDDPLKLQGFYSILKPLAFYSKLRGLLPSALYSAYAEQARELNDVTRRIQKLTLALKVRGFYNASLEGLNKVLTSEDNVLLPIENMQSMPDLTAEKMLYLLPIDTIIKVLQQLLVQRQQIKATIYEITGISDIIRGSSVASETATAQDLKSQWGTLRLKKAQKAVQVYVRGYLRLMLEAAVTNLSEKTLLGMVDFPQDKLSDPGVLQAFSQALTLLKNDLSRGFKIDIETNSTLDAEATEDKTDIAELLNAIAQFLNGVSPLVEKKLMPMEAAKSMLLDIARRFKVGSEFEEALSMIGDPAHGAAEGGEGDPAKEAEKVKAQTTLQVTQMKAQADMAKLKMEMQQAEQEMAFRKQEHEFKMQETMLKHQTTMAQLQAKNQQMVLQASLPSPIPSAPTAPSARKGEKPGSDEKGPTNADV